MRKAAMVSAVGYILMMGSPVAEALYGGLVNPANPSATINNIETNILTFRHCILLYLVNFSGDILAAWGLYVLLKPAWANLSLLAAWLRIVYTIMSLCALMNLFNVIGLLDSQDYLHVLSAEQIRAQVMIDLRSFRNGWSLSFIFFGIYLIILGFLIIYCKYIPRIVGIAVAIAGIGWLTDNIQPLLFDRSYISIGMVAGFGELVLLIWLLIWGIRLKPPPLKNDQAI
ncbi:MAG TPA: DUF4386 domain-containing protein [Puia sp.]|nr:DUF4386 domain-containing protein [Puia sp.]